MTIDEFLGDFDEDDYTYSISKLNQLQLRKEHDLIRRKVVAAKSTIGASGLSAFHTLGFSLIGAGIGWRKHNYNAKKQNICEARMRREGWGVEEMRTRDFLMAVGPSAVASVILPGAESAAGHLISHAAGHGAAAWTSQHAAETFVQATQHSGQFVHGLGDGISSQLHSVGSGLLGHTTNLVPINAVAQNTPQFLGNVAGQGLANAAEMEAVHRGTKYVTERGVRSLLSPRASMEAAMYSNKRIGSSSGSTAVHTRDKVGKRNISSSSSNKYGVQTSSSNHVHTRPALVYLSNLGPFLFYLLPPLINDIVGLRGLQSITMLVILSDLFTSDRTRLLWTWTYLSAPALIATVAGSTGLWLATFSWELMMACGAFRTSLITPGVLACAAAPLMPCTSGHFNAFITGIFWFSFIMALVQFSFTGESFDKMSAKYIRWCSLRRPEYVTMAILLLVTIGRGHLDEKYLPSWIGAGSVGLFMTMLQVKARH